MSKLMKYLVIMAFKRGGTVERILAIIAVLLLLIGISSIVCAAFLCGLIKGLITLGISLIIIAILIFI